MSNIIRTTIDSRLRVDQTVVPTEIIWALTEALEIPNLAKEQAKKMDQWGWQRMPDKIALWSNDENGWLSMPRGFLEYLANGAEAFGMEIRLVEGRNRWHHTPIGEPIDLRPWQRTQVDALLEWEQGMLKAPAGSGKTVTILAAIQETASKALVIVNTKDIMWQWQKRIETFLPVYPPAGQIGDGVFEVSQFITIATAQTLHSRFEKLEEEGFFDAFSFVCLDECHHATADTYNRILDRFSSRYRVGVSATPDKTGDFALATNILGPVIHEVRPQEVTTLMVPQVVRVPTRFGFMFRGQRSRWQRSNYPQMVQALINDPGRNTQIIGNILSNEGCHQLLVTKRLDHIELLREMLYENDFVDPIYTLTGNDSNERREEAVAALNEAPGLILSTLADEALDIPRLDRLHLVFPQKNPGLVTQQVGRVERDHPDKKDARIYDYADGNVGPLEKQWRVRRFEVYEPRGYKIITQSKEQR